MTTEFKYAGIKIGDNKLYMISIRKYKADEYPTIAGHWWVWASHAREARKLLKIMFKKDYDLNEGDYEITSVSQVQVLMSKDTVSIVK